MNIKKISKGKLTNLSPLLILTRPAEINVIKNGCTNIIYLGIKSERKSPKRIGKIRNEIKKNNCSFFLIICLNAIYVAIPIIIPASRAVDIELIFAVLFCCSEPNRIISYMSLRGRRTNSSRPISTPAGQARSSE